MLIASIGKDKKRIKIDNIKQNGEKNKMGALLSMVKSKEYHLGAMNGDMQLTNKFEVVTDVTGWGDRDDSFRKLQNGGIFWVRAPQDKGDKLVISEFNGIDDGDNVDFNYMETIALVIGLLILLL
ncbi:hypothetical protein EIN_201610 [Entamoeba invadens IP1]|uniref:Uncharacterized protein n=1 Tax=Entamoeba invadens IP1 TaxID=370355 RepID=A0A0A1U5V2_ENTIV|nr:hypothetical protein EIN_201610 [Entamoeba invadens IP1]ELP89636.1 hypothetical protein EIN_201610 [Entamoeba invadens IP1]|eukprot:XP_004256407.1 hypothetical protein EIN_201610 [Entamoeba invadens IP1]